MEAVRHSGVSKHKEEEVKLLAEAAVGIHQPERVYEHEVALLPNTQHTSDGETLVTSPSEHALRVRSEIRATRSLLHAPSTSNGTNWRVKQEGFRYGNAKAESLHSAIFTTPPEAVVHAGSDALEALQALGHLPVFEFVRRGFVYRCTNPHSLRSTRIRLCDYLPVHSSLDPQSASNPLEDGLLLVDVAVSSVEDSVDEWEACDTEIERVARYLRKASVSLEKTPNIVAGSLVFDTSLPRTA